VTTLLLVGDGRRRRRAAERASQHGIELVDAEPADAVLVLDEAGQATTARNKIALRRRLADVGVPQPQFAAVRSIHEGHAALAAVGVPAVLKPADGHRQRAVFRLGSADDLDAHLHRVLVESPQGEAIVESFHDGSELNVVAVARGPDVTVLTVSDRRSGDGNGFAVATAHVSPTALFGDALEEVERVVGHAARALELRDTLLLAQVLVSADGPRVLSVAAGLPGGELDRVAEHAADLDLVEIALRQALREDVPDELVTPGKQTPVALRFLTAQPGPLPLGRAAAVGTVDKALAFPGVVEVVLELEAGDEIRPLRTADDRYGYVIAAAATNLEAEERADAAARLLDVVVEP
jgi:cysteine synthase A